MKKILILGVLIVLAHINATAQYYITTIAGNDTFGHTGDGGPAAAAQIGSAAQVTADSAGNIYFADEGFNCIRKIAKATGIITTVAGVPDSSGYSGDGGLAIHALFNGPQGVAVDDTGNIYIADTYNNVIRRVDHATGIITLYAGGGISVIVNGEPATNASLGSPTGLCMDKHGNLFISDPLNDVVRMVNPHDSTWIVAGITGAGFSGDGFPAPSAALNHPWAVFVDTNDNLYIADEGNHRIRKVDGVTTIISTVAGNGGTGYIGSGDSIMATSTGIGNIYGVWVDNAGNIFFPDAAYNRIKKIDAISHMLYVIADSSADAGFSGDGGRARSALLHAPHTLCLDKAGDIYIADLNNTRIRKMYACTVPVANFTHTGSPVVTFHYSGTTSGVDSVHWHFGDGTNGTGTTPIHTYTAAGTYSVCATAYTNCDSNTRCSNVIITLTSVGGSILPGADVSVYPNPANDLLHINEVKGHIVYRLTDISGTSLLHGYLLQESNTISIQGLAPGIYILELRNDDGQRTMVKIVKQ